MYLIANGRLLTLDKDLPYIENGDVVVDGNLIKEIGSTDKIRQKYPDAEYIDAEGRLIMPGFISTHTHMYTALSRGLKVYKNKPDFSFEVLEGFLWKYDRALTLGMDKLAAYLTIIDCIKSGITTIFDHHASYYQISGSLLSLASVVRDTGMRACLCYEVSDRNGKQKADQAIDENIDFLDYTQQLNSGTLKAMFGLQSSLTLSESTLRRCVRRNNGRMGFHLHSSECIGEVFDCIKQYNVRPIVRLYNEGVLGKQTIISQCVHVNDKEMELIRNTDSMVISSNHSHMLSSGGGCPVAQMSDMGILLGLGTDSYSCDMLENLRTSALLQSYATGDPMTAYQEAASMVFYGNRSIASRFFDVELGIIKPGAAADIIIMDYSPFTPFDAENALRHVVNEVSGKQCITSMVGGKLLMHNRKLALVDEDYVRTEAMKYASELWDKLI